ncbi:MAG TPA: hypothetical protein VGK17_15175 [Propionicimonas sp.]
MNISKKSQAVGAASLPQVNLLPPEVRAARGLKVVKRVLALALVGVLILIGGVYALSLLQRTAAENELADAQRETKQLQAQEDKYAEVPAVRTALDTTKHAREFAMSTEVQWSGYLAAITAVLPPDASVETFTLAGATPMALPELAASPLQAPSVGTLSFTGRTATVPDTAAWIDALNSVPGFSDAWVSSAVVEGEDGNTYYTVLSTVQVTDQAYDHRFAVTEEKS